MADCGDYDHIAAWGETPLEVLRRHLPCEDGVPGGRWLTILMNRINPALFQAAFTAWVREAWPDRPEFVAIDAKTSRRSHDRVGGGAPSHLVSAFAAAPPGALQTSTDADKGPGRSGTRSVSILHEADWLSGERRFPGELRLPDAACLIRVAATTGRAARTQAETRYCIASASLTAARAANAVRGHWGIGNRLHWVLDAVFREDQSRLRKGHGARNMAVVRHFARNLVRAASDKRSIKLRRKLAGWRPGHLNNLLNPKAS